MLEINPFSPLLLFAGLTAAAYFYTVPSQTVTLKGLEPTEEFPDSIYEEHGISLTPTDNFKLGYVDLGYKCNTHYYLIGPKSGRKLVFVHGLSTPPPMFKFFLKKLAAKGYRILCYDIYGRGFSGSPPDPYSNGFLISQLVCLLHKLQWGETDMIGYSLGGALTTGYVARYPNLVKKVVLLAPAGIMKSTSPLVYIARIPVFGQIFLHTVGKAVLKKLSTTNALNRECEDVKHYNQAQLYQLINHPAIMRTVGSTMLHFDFGGSHKDFASLEVTHKGKVFCLWGSLDTVVPSNLAPEVQELIPSAEVVVKEGFSHAIVIEDSSLCVELIHKFFS